MMIDFIRALGNPQISFLRYAFIGGLLASVSFGIIGTYVVTRRISYLAGAISHSILAGIGAGLYLQSKFALLWFTPLLGALIAGLVSSLIIGLVSMYASQREDTVIGAIWAIGMAAGLLLLAKTPGYVDPMSYLFGNILLTTKADLWLIAGLDVLVVTLGVLFYNQILAVCFDEEFARMRGLRVGVYYLGLLFLTALTIVLLVTTVGIVMVIAMLTLPPAVAGFFGRKLWQIMILAGLFCMLFATLGIGISYSYDLPTGATIIMIAGIVYLAAVFLKRFKKKSRYSGKNQPH